MWVTRARDDELLKHLLLFSLLLLCSVCVVARVGLSVGLSCEMVRSLSSPRSPNYRVSGGDFNTWYRARII